MNIPEIENFTPFQFAPLYLADEAARPLLVLIVRATFAVDADGHLVPAAEQLAVKPAGEFWGTPGESSYKQEPDAAFVKMATDVVLIGSACAPDTRTAVMNVGLAVGAMRKVVRVFGDRYWVRGLVGTQISEPLPFERMPLIYERAFGGWDRSAQDPALHSFEDRNPVGVGFHGKGGSFTERGRLPNLEDPSQLIAGFMDRPVPAGFGFTSPGWQPRAGWAGTYDETWQRTRMPALPADFDRRFFSAASTGLVAAGFLRGDESVLVRGVSAHGDVRFDLPGPAPADFHVHLRSRPPVDVVGDLDTLVIDTDAMLLQMTWRARVPLIRGAQDVVAIQIGAPPVAVAGDGD